MQPILKKQQRFSTASGEGEGEGKTGETGREANNQEVPIARGRVSENET